MARLWEPAAPHSAFRRGLVESYFLRLNDPAGRWAAWIRYTFLTRTTGARTGDCWFIFFDRADPGAPGVHAYRETFAEQYLDVRRGVCDISIGDNRLASDSCSGHIAAGGVSWRFNFAAAGKPCALSPWYLLLPRSPLTKLTTPIAEGFASGEIEARGGRYAFDGIPMSLGHNWGRRHTTRYAWTQARTTAAGHRLFFEGFALPLGDRGPAPLSLAMGKAFLDGREISFAGLPSAALRNRSFATPGRLVLELENRLWRLDADVSWNPAAVAGLRYVQPDGKVSTCLNSMVANAAFVLTPLTLSGPDGKAALRFDISASAALEFLSPEPVPGYRATV